MGLFGPDYVDEPVDQPPPQPGFAQRWLGQGTLLGTAGDTLSRGGYFVRNLLAGKPGAAVRGLPGALGGLADVLSLNSVKNITGKGANEYVDDLTGFKPEDRTSTQDLMKQAGILDHAHHGFFQKDSWMPDPAFEAGLVGDITTDPLTFLTGGLNQAGKAAKIASGAEQYAVDLANAENRARSAGDLFKLKQLNDLPAVPVPGGPRLAATKAEQAAQGQRDFLRIGNQRLIGGENLYKLGDKAGELAGRLPGAKAIGNLFAHGPVQDVSSYADAVKRSTNDDFLRARELLIKANAGDQAAAGALDQFFASRGVTNGVTPADKFAQLMKSMDATEEHWGHNVGSDYLQQDTNAKNILGDLQRPENRQNAQQIIDDLNAAIAAKQMQAGQAPTTVLGAGHANNNMAQAIDQAYRNGLDVREINDVFRARTGNGLVSEDLAHQLQMRGAQHATARARSEFAQGAVDQGLAMPVKAGQLPAKGVIEPGGLVESVTMPNGQKVYRIPDLKYSNTESLVFHDIDSANQAAKAYNQMYKPTVGPVGKLFDTVNAPMRQLVTRVFPQFHMQNHLSNRAQSYLENVPPVGRHYSMANDLMAGKDIGTVQLPNGQAVTGEQLLNEYKHLNQGLAGQFDEVAGELPRLGAEYQGKLSKAYNGALDFAERAAATPAAVGQLARNPGMLGKISGQGIESADRLGHYLYKRVVEGLPPNEAMKSVEAALFNYSPAALTDFERNVARRGALFYGYPRSALPFVLSKAAENPGKISNMLKLGQQPGRPQDMPRYLQDQGTVGLGTDDSALSNIPSPIEGAAKPFGGFNEGFGRGLEALLGSSSPLIKGGYELASGRDPFTGRDVSAKAPNWLPNALSTQRLDSNGKAYNEVNPLLNLLLQNIPTSRAMNTLNTAMSDKATLGDTALNFLTGAKVNRFEPELEKVYGQIADTNSELDQFAKQGFLKKTQYGYAAEPAARGRIPPKASLLLRKFNTLRQQAKIIKQRTVAKAKAAK